MNNLAISYPGEKPDDKIQTANIGSCFFVNYLLFPFSGEI
jgi:hypothetical protein